MSVAQHESHVLPAPWDKGCTTSVFLTNDQALRICSSSARLSTMVVLTPSPIETATDVRRASRCTRAVHRLMSVIGGDEGQRGDLCQEGRIILQGQASGRPARHATNRNSLSLASLTSFRVRVLDTRLPDAMIVVGTHAWPVGM